MTATTKERLSHLEGYLSACGYQGGYCGGQGRYSRTERELFDLAGSRYRRFGLSQCPADPSRGAASISTRVRDEKKRPTGRNPAPPPRMIPGIPGTPGKIARSLFKENQAPRKTVDEDLPKEGDWWWSRRELNPRCQDEQPARRDLPVPLLPLLAATRRGFMSPQHPVGQSLPVHPSHDRFQLLMLLVATPARARTPRASGSPSGGCAIM